MKKVEDKKSRFVADEAEIVVHSETPVGADIDRDVEVVPLTPNNED